MKLFDILKVMNLSINSVYSVLFTYYIIYVLSKNLSHSEVFVLQ